MGNNYHFVKDPKPISSEEIRGKMDFDALLEQVTQGEKPQKSRLRLLWPVLAVAASVTLLLIVFNPFASSPSYQDLAKAHFRELPYVAPPVADAAAPVYTSKTISAQTGTVIETPKGVRMVVPSYAFQTDRGANIEGDVAIKYRELFERMDYFRAGIPMEYDSAGVRYQLITAGMIEVYAEYEGQAVDLAPGKTIQLVFPAEIDQEETADYQVYVLDKNKRNWRFVQSPKWTLVQKPSSSTSSSATSSTMQDWDKAHPMPEKPKAPNVHNSSRPAFDFAVVNEEYLDKLPADLRKLYKNTIWQLNSDVDISRLQTAWESSTLTPLGEHLYRLTLYKGSENISLEVTPVLVGEDYTKAKAGYDQALAKYEQQVADRQRLRAEQLQSVSAPESQATASSSGYRASVEVSSLGIWNLDKAVRMPENSSTISLEDKAGKPLKDGVIYAFNAAENTLYRFVANGNNTPIPVEVLQDNTTMWVTTSDKKTALITKGSQVEQLGTAWKTSLFYSTWEELGLE